MCSNFILMTILNRISNHSYCHMFLECPYPHQIIEKEKLMQKLFNFLWQYLVCDFFILSFMIGVLNKN